MATLVEDLVHMNFCQNEAGLHWARCDDRKFPRKLLSDYRAFELDEGNTTLDMQRKNTQKVSSAMIDSLVNCLEHGGKFYVDNLNKQLF